MTASHSEKEIRRSETQQSMLSIVFHQFLDHRMAVAGAVTIFVLCLIAICAPLISAVTGLDPDRQNVSARYLMPFERALAPADQKETETEAWMRDNPTEAQGFMQEIAQKESLPAPTEDSIYNLAAMDATDARTLLKKYDSPGAVSFNKMTRTWSTLHIFGTDEIGRDVFIRLIYGARVSIGVGVLVAVASALVGFLIGAIAGYYGGFIDSLLMRVTDALLSLPLFPVLIVFAAIDLTKIPWLKELIGGSSESIFKMVIILCLFSWMTVARLVRGSILSLREREFVLAAKTLGARDRTIIFRHMFPNVFAPMLVSITLGVGESILFEAALSFLGLGIMPPTASWGNMLNNAQEVIYKNLWLAILPGLMILITVVSFNFFGDGLQDAMDPKAIRR